MIIYKLQALLGTKKQAATSSAVPANRRQTDVFQRKRL